MNGNALTPTSGIKFKDKIGYALGDTAGLFTFALIGSFLQIFYTNVMHISAAKIVVLMIVARIWDAINDPIWGSIIDRRNPGKNGKFRPYLKWVSLPLAISGFLVFVKIPGLSENQYLIYAYVTYIMYGMMYTGINIPYGSLASMVTTDELERSDLSVFRSLGAGLGGLPAQILLPLVVYSYAVDEMGNKILDEAGKAQKYLDGTKLMLAVALLAGMSVIVYLFSYKLTKERVPGAPVKEKADVWGTVRVLLKNRPFVTLCIASMFLIATQQYTQTVYNYLFLDYFKKPELYALVTVFTYLPMALLIPFMKKCVARFGKKELCAYGMALSAVASFLLWILKTQNVYVFFVLCFMSGLGMTFFIMEIWALVTDVIDYQERLSGRREEGTSYAFFSFTRKLGQTIAGSMGAAVIGLIGYNDTATAQTQEVLDKMYTVSTALPALMCVVMALVLGLGYPLGKQKLAQLNAERKMAEGMQ